MPETATRSGGATNTEPRRRDAHARIPVGKFLPILIQLGLILAVALLFRVEFERGFGVIAPLILVGFAVHSWLPFRTRGPFFVLLTFLALVLLLRIDGLWVVGLGLGLLGLCHVPVPWSAKAAMVLAAAAFLAVIQGGWFDSPWTGPVIAILAAMFMFRMILYLYDLKTDRTPAAPWQRIAYFFLLPNLCFPLFPVVDYKTFLRTYYDSPAHEVYQKGVGWMLRGVVHLLLYRIIYYAMPRFSDPTDVIGVYVLMAMTYGMYLRVSGLFHLIAGILCLFGFNLPATNNHYFLASSFNDLWRRINIYWKDFMMTVVFYPVFMSARGLKMGFRLVLGTLMVFLVTWFLHSYQWFWLEGEFPIRANDIVFWGFLAVALAVNTIWEARHGRRRRLGSTSWSPRDALGLTARTIGVFSIMAFLWGLWYSGSLAEWWYLILRVRESDAAEWTLFGGLTLTVLLAGVAGHWLGAHGWGLIKLERLAWARASLIVPMASTALVVIGLPFVYGQVGGEVERVVKRVQSAQPNQMDRAREERGYYEALTRASQFRPVAGWGTETEKQVPFNETAIVRGTDDIRGFELVPGSQVAFRGSTIRVNRWGMRDREYERAKPAGSYRLAIIGSSHAMGWGVADQETFENLVEDRLNRELGEGLARRFEVLNFAVSGYGLPQELYVAERIVPSFEPDAVIVVLHPGEAGRLVDRLQIALGEFGGEIGSEYGYVEQVLAKADARVDLPAREFARRLRPYGRDLLRWSLGRTAGAIRTYEAHPVFVLVPLPDRDFRREEQSELIELATETGATVIGLREVYDDHQVDSVRLGDRDNHPSALGHRLIADRLYLGLVEHAAELGLLSEPQTRDPSAQ